MGLATRDKVSEHLLNNQSLVRACQKEKYFNSIEWSTGAFGVELNTPHPFPRFNGRLDTLNGRVVAIDEEWFPTFREGILQF
jgi:hypothetical protein